MECILCVDFGGDGLLHPVIRGLDPRIHAGMSRAKPPRSYAACSQHGLPSQLSPNDEKEPFSRRDPRPSLADAINKNIAARDRRQTFPAVAAGFVTIVAAQERTGRMSSSLRGAKRRSNPGAACIALNAGLLR
jgi:hypothetical protein